MKKSLGYIVSILGLGVLVIGSGIIKINSEIFNSINSSYIIGLGMGLVILGVIIVMLDKGSQNKNSKQSEEEVPIYEGTGKKRKIVGYRRN